MQTKRQIQQLLTSAGVVPNRKFGQHFLVDLNLLKLVVDSAQIGPDDVVLEVGCGTGSMTEALAERAGRVVAAELDPTLATIARSQLAQASNVELVEGDALSSKGSFNPAVIAAVGAFPDAVVEAMEKNEPYLVTRAVMGICAAFNKFYYEQRIMADDETVRQARLALTDATRRVVAIGLGLIGVAAPERM